MVGSRFRYSVFSTYNFDTYQFGYQHELVSLGALRNLSAPQLSAGPLGGRKITFRNNLSQAISKMFTAILVERYYG